MDKNGMKYYFVSSKRLAITIEFISGLKYLIHDHRNDPTKKVYSFENTNELQNALAKIMELKHTLSNN